MKQKSNLLYLTDVRFEAIRLYQYFALVSIAKLGIQRNNVRCIYRKPLFIYRYTACTDRNRDAGYDLTIMTAVILSFLKAFCYICVLLGRI
jgi:hypothetical protein